MEYRQFDKQYVIRLARGERLVETLTEFVQLHKIAGGFFFGIGAADEVELAHYSVEDQKYSSQTYSQPLEITNLTGNVAYFEGKPLIHCHATVSDPQMNCFGGHLVEARISGTLELFLSTTSKLEKEIDKETGLKLLTLS